MENILKNLSASTPEAAADRFLEKILEVNPGVSTELIRKAFLFSWDAHSGQRRKSGEPYLVHPVSVAFILAEQKLDAVTIAAGLLHDVLEDTQATGEELANLFGGDVALLVDGVTKIRALQMNTRRQHQAETYRKMLLSMAKDLRVIIIKFADRIHNLRTLGFLEPKKIKAIATETLDIYSPLALRLGMAKIRCELEDLAFKHLHPEEYKEIVSKVVASRVDREAAIEDFAVPLRAALEAEGINATISGRSKHFFSIYSKMKKRGKPYEEIYDVLAIRVIVNTVRECYCALGVIHSLWMPVQERFKDYISAPKSNGYRSLHTTVAGNRGNVVELQIRDWEMNKTAEEGVAAHWLYKNGERAAEMISKDDKALAWLRNIIEWQENLTDSAEFYEFFKVDLFDTEVFAFTPKGSLITLPKGATVLDFAFAVHTQLGIHCIGAKINGQVEPVGAELKSGQTVEILHLQSKTPSADMLSCAKTPKARSAIHHWLRNAERQESVDLGKKIISHAYEKIGAHTPFGDHAPELLLHLGIGNVERLYELVGRGDLTESRVMKYFQARKIKRRHTPSKMMSDIVKSITGQRSQGILIGGQSNLMVRFAECCNPIPGDEIIGFLTRGRGISVHRADCPHAKLFENDKERKMEVSWDNGEHKKYYITIKIIGADRTGLLHEVSSVFTEFGANVSSGNVRSFNGKAEFSFQIEIRNLNQLKQIFRQLQKVKGIENVARVKDFIPIDSG
jgi:GTP pyrophosphokinase